MVRYSDLFQEVICHDRESIIPFLQVPWKSKDKQEALFRLFAHLQVIPEFHDYDVCVGNFNTATVKKEVCLNKFFQQSIKDKGDKSDLTLISKDDSVLVATTSKNLSTYGVNDLDIDNIQSIFTKDYQQSYTLRVCFVVRDKSVLLETAKRCNSTSERLRDVITDASTIIFDWNDINIWYHHFMSVYSNKTVADVIACMKVPLIMKPHQELSVVRTLLLVKNHKTVLWGHIPRSGKSYIMGGTIIKSDMTNYLIITTAPSESIHQYLAMFAKYSQFNEFNVLHLNGDSVKKPSLGAKNILICSKQFLQSKVDVKVKWLSNMKFGMRFIDESHHGGTTELSQKVLDAYGNSAITVFITATYTKPMNTFDIPRDAWILWDLEDIKLCKSIQSETSFRKLVHKHGESIRTVFDTYTHQHIVDTYSMYPELHIMTWDFKEDVKNAIIETYRSSPYGFSTDSVLLLKQSNGQGIPEFQKEPELLKLCHAIFGKTETNGMFVTKSSDSILDRIERICKNGNINSRWFSVEEPLTILCFLPCNITGESIDVLQCAFAEFLVRINVLPDFEVVYVNSKTNKGKTAIEIIEDGRARVKLQRKKGLLVLTGRMCSLAVSIHHCDIVLMMNNTEQMDMYYQMMFRCMTEAPKKKCGFVVDLNLQRVTNVIVDYALRLLSAEKQPTKAAIKYILEQRLIGFSNDEWMHNFFGLNSVNVDSLVDRLYSIYSEKPSNAIENILKTLEMKVTILSDDQQQFNSLFTTTASKKQLKEAVDELTRVAGVKKGILAKPTGISEDAAVSEDGSDSDTMMKKKPDVNLIKDVMKHLLPLLCLITIHDGNTNTFAEMCEWISDQQEEKSILVDQLTTWWGRSLSSSVDIIGMFSAMYKKYLSDNDEFNTAVMRLKDMFAVSKGNAEELSKLIDKYLVPQELEKKQNAEVSTPYALRQEMLDKMPEDFWYIPNTVFEPCSGKGGFLLDIVARFMEGLKNSICDEEERYKIIVEKCLYFSDINPTNIFICKLLLDPFGKYKLNCNEGNTLDLDIKEKWGLEGFDAVIGNPPYSTDPSKQDTTPLYNLFTEMFIDHTTYLLYVTPSRWFVGGKGLDKFRKMMMQRKDVKLIVHNDKCKEWFGKHVEIKGGCSYFLIDKTHHGECSFNGEIYDLSKYDVIVKPKFHDIIDKLAAHESITKIYLTRGLYKLETNDKQLKDDGGITVYVSSLKSKERTKYIDTYAFTDGNRTWKVITAEAAHGGESGFSRFKQVLTPDEIYTNSYVGFRVSSREKGESLISYLETKLANYMLSIRKQTQHINTDVVKWVPLVPLDRKWTDEMVYEYFGLTAGEIAKIET
jgi:type I restriction-modification system DNA methylase subunit